MSTVISKYRPTSGCTANFAVERDGAVSFVCVTARTEIRWQGASDSDELLEHAAVSDIHVGSELDLMLIFVSFEGQPPTYPAWGKALWIIVKRGDR